MIPILEALRVAEKLNLDLVEIQPNVEPPVCKILDYGKYKYEAQKRKNEARKKQKIIEVKEIKLIKDKLIAHYQLNNCIVHETP